MYNPCLQVDGFEGSHTAQKMKFSIKDFLSKCDQIRRKLRIWLHLLKKSLMENFIFVQCHTNCEYYQPTQIFRIYNSPKEPRF